MPQIASTKKKGGAHCCLCGWEIDGLVLADVEKRIVHHLTDRHAIQPLLVTRVEVTRPRLLPPEDPAFEMPVVQYDYPRVVSWDSFRAGKRTR